MKDSLTLARQTIREPAEALNELAGILDTSFSTAVQLILKGSDQTIVTGIGKSGLIARKIAARWPARERRRCLCTRSRACMAIWGRSVRDRCLSHYPKAVRPRS